jgi:hypothetical protein
LQINEPLGRAAEIIPSRVRWLAIAAGCVSGTAGSLLFGPLFFLFASVQILGAIVQPHSPRSGRLLLSVGAFLLSFYTFLFLGPQAFGAISMWSSYIDFNHVTLFVLLLISLLSVAWCDVALIADARRLSRIQRMAEYRFPRAGDWIVWIVAACLSVALIPTSVWGIFVYRRTARFDILALSLVLGLGSVLFDVALVVSAVKIRREQRLKSLRS